MKITPLEIRQKTFEKKLRGYDKEEVEAFLMSLSQEWEQTQEELRELKLQYVNAEKEIKQLREVENSLFKTLKTAEDTGANLIDQANKTAELHMRETQMNADALLNEAKSKARATMEDADMRARHILDKMEVELSHIKQDYKHLENLKDAAIAELKNLSNDILTRIGKFDSGTNPERSAGSEINDQQEADEENIQLNTDRSSEVEDSFESTDYNFESDKNEDNMLESMEDSQVEEGSHDSLEEDQSSEPERVEEQNQENYEENVPAEEKPSINVEGSDDDDSSFFDKIQ